MASMAGLTAEDTMVSTEVLRRYPFFAGLNDEQLRELAMISQQRNIENEELLFEEEAGADALYLLEEGSVELHHIVVDERGMEKRQDFLVGIINPGEVFGISAMIEPNYYTASAICNRPSQVLELAGPQLRALCEADVALYVPLLEQVAAITRQRLQDTRVQLA